MENLTKAILAAMQEVDNIDKNMTVGSGANSYSGVADKDVKIAIGKVMIKHGLVILPISIEPTTKVDRWEETNSYGTKTKQSVFTEVKTRYKIMHVSGESIEIEGLGHGVDPQDKAAGKATTYALKNALLYSFMIPTGKIDDADTTHSDDHATPQKGTKTAVTKSEEKKQEVKAGTAGFKKVAKWLAENPDQAHRVKLSYTISDADYETLLKEAEKLKSAPKFVEIVHQDTIDAIAAAASSEELTKIWNELTDLHTSEEFIKLITDRKDQILLPGKKKTA